MMIKFQNVWLGLLAGLALGMVTPISALPIVESRSPNIPIGALEERLTRLEDQLNINGLQGDTLHQVSALQQEVQELRGMLEQQDHEIKRLERALNDSGNDLLKSKSQKVSLKETKEVKESKKNSITMIPIEKTANPELNPEKQTTETALHEAAQAYLKEKNWIEAEKKYQEYLSLYPNGQFAANTHYSLGEIYWTQWHREKTDALMLEKALHAYSDVTNGFSGHAKARDAMLKLGMIEVEKGNWQSAAEQFKKVMARYPNSPAAKIAELRIQKLVEEGRVS